MCDFRDIYTSRCNIGCNEYVVLSFSKPVNRILTLILRHVSLERCDSQPKFLKIQSEISCSSFSSGKNHHLASGCMTQQMGYHTVLHFVCCRIKGVTDCSCWSDNPYLNSFWFLENVRCKCSNFWLDSSRKKQCLFYCREMAKYAANIWQKSHIKHRVCFINH